MSRIQASPFVPGRVRGMLRHGLQNAAPDVLLVIDYRELSGLPAEPLGLVVVDAAPLSHHMIRLLGRGVPTVMIGRRQLTELSYGQEWQLDGSSGLLVAGDEPLPEVADKAVGRTVPGEPVMTSDGIAIQLLASVSDSRSAGGARHGGATAIGLVRSEYLLPDDGRPVDAEFFEQAIDAVCQAAAPLPVTVRLVDIAPDKRNAWSEGFHGAAQSLGVQGSRLYGEGAVAEMVQAQLSALNRLAGRQPLAVLIPYVSSTEELAYWQTVIRPRLSANMAVGVMAETPAAALDVRALLAMADFVAIGCNDLMQCLFGADRDLPQVAYLLDPYNPVLFRFLAQVAEAAGGEAGQLQLCGLLPQYPRLLAVLIGLGFRCFSVEPVMLGELAESAACCDSKAAQQLAHEVCQAADGDAVRRLLGLPAGQPWQTPAERGNDAWH